jgi:adenylate cyclase class 2
MLETEVKIRIADGPSVYSKITEFAKNVVPIIRFEDDALYDFEDRKLFKSGSLFRLRISSNAVRDGAGNFSVIGQKPEYILTWKGPAETSRGFKEREEIEFNMKDSASVFRMLESFGLEPVFRYQKFRSLFDLHSIKITYDKTPMGLFLELEGDSRSIDETAILLGFSGSDYISLDYYVLWKEYCRNGNLPESDMLFRQT